MNYIFVTRSQQLEYIDLLHIEKDVRFRIWFLYFDRHVMDVRRLTEIIENLRLPSISVGVICMLDNLTMTVFLFASAVEMF